MTLNNYLTHQLLKSHVIIFLIIYVILIGNYLEMYLTKAAQGYLGLNEVLKLILFRSANLTPLILPVSSFLSLIFLFKSTTRNNELIVMRASGLSWQILYTYLTRPMLIICAISLILNFMICPITSYKANQIVRNTGNKSIEYVKENNFYKLHNNQEILILKKKAIQEKDLLLIKTNRDQFSIIFLPKYDLRRGQTTDHLHAMNGWINDINTKNLTTIRQHFRKISFNLFNRRYKQQFNIASVNTLTLFYAKTHQAIVELNWRLILSILPIIGLCLAFPFYERFANKNKKHTTPITLLLFSLFYFLITSIKIFTLHKNIFYGLSIDIPCMLVILCCFTWIATKDSRRNLHDN